MCLTPIMYKPVFLINLFTRRQFCTQIHSLKERIYLLNKAKSIIMKQPTEWTRISMSKFVTKLQDNPAQIELYIAGSESESDNNELELVVSLGKNSIFTETPWLENWTVR